MTMYQSEDEIATRITLLHSFCASWRTHKIGNVRNTNPSPRSKPIRSFSYSFLDAGLKCSIFGSCKKTKTNRSHLNRGKLMEPDALWPKFACRMNELDPLKDPFLFFIQRMCQNNVKSDVALV